MPLKDDYLFQIRIMTSILYASNGTICIVVKRPYAYLAKNLENVFNGQEDVRITVDKRYNQRRIDNKGTDTGERRRDERRQLKETLVDVILSD